MSVILRLLSTFSGILVFSGVVRLLVRRKLDEADSFLWLCIGLFAIISGCFPGVVTWFATFLGIDYPPILVLVIATIIVLFVIFKQTIDISIHKAQNHELAMQVSMLNSEVKHLIEQCKDLESQMEDLNHTPDAPGA